MSYLPFVPPNVGGFPKGARLLGPSNLVHTFDLVQIAGTVPQTTSVDALDGTPRDLRRQRHVARGRRREHDPDRRFVLAVTSPEFTLT